MSAIRKPAQAGELVQRQAPASSASTYDDAAREIDVCWAAGAKVRRRSWAEGEFIEALDMSPSAIVLDRLQNGGSVLNAHSAFDMGDRVGTIVEGSVRVTGGKGFARIRLSRNAMGEMICQDLRDGHPIAISVGYSILESTRTEGVDGALPTITATRWEPHEISIVPVPADPNAKSRNLPKGNMMDDETELLDNPASTPAPARRSAPRDRMDATFPKAQARRSFGARSLEGADLDDFVRDTEGKSEREVRAAFIDKQAHIQERHPIFSHVATRGLDMGSDRNGALIAALRARIRPSAALEAAAQQYRGISIPEVARICLRDSGGFPAASAAEAVTRALHTTSDFPIILGAVLNQNLRADRPVAASGLKRVAKASTVPDFRDKSSIEIGTAPDLLPVNEHGEFRRGTWRESQERYRIFTSGRITGLTRQALINDSLGAFSTIPQKFRAQADRYEAQALAALVELNPKMADGKGVFHGDHGTIMAPAALSQPAVKEARLAFRRQRDRDGHLIMDVPRFLVVPIALETTAEEILAEISPARLEDVNVFGGNKLELIVDPYLENETAWYLVGSAQNNGLEYSYLEGYEGPFFDTRVGFDVDGIEIKCRLDFGAGFLDWLGWLKNPGA